MIKFFRKIRLQFLKENKLRRYLIYAIGEIVLVVIGILIALQVNNWNLDRKNRTQERFILERLSIDLNSDLDLLTYQIEKASIFLKQYKFCSDVLLGEKDATRELFIENLSSILIIIYFEQNRTTFQNIISTGQIEYIQNQGLADSIIKYYSDGINIGWDSGLRDYTRNTFAPYLLKFDHIPNHPQTSYRSSASVDFTEIDYSKSTIQAKSVDDYRKDIFILNMLRNKIYMMEGQVMEYEILKKMLIQLQEQISKELNKRR